MGDIVRVVRKGRFIGWYVRYKDVDGRRRMRASHQPSKELARRYLLEVEGRVARGILGIPEPAPPAPTVAELVTRFLSEYSRPRIKDLPSYRLMARCALRRMLPMLGTRRADTVQAEDIVRLREALGIRYAAASVRSSLAFLGTVYSWALKAGLVAKNPCRGVERPAPAALVEYLSRDEATRLLRLAREQAPATHPGLYPLLATVLFTGLRKGELLGLRWSDIDLDGRRLTVARSFASTPKSGKPRHLRLPSTLAPILAEWRGRCPHTPEGLVFPVVSAGRARLGSAEDMLGVHELLAAAACRPLTRAFHALRHTFASHYMMAGGNLLALQKILGHSDVRMTMIYAHLAPEFLGEEMERVKF
ncbi:MAG TPA: site-specific integrase [Pseudomonadota bacterium]|nr:site-specific integrase [Pseudomonadota bacterium]